MAITADALRMRTRRMCEKKPSGKLLVDDEIHNQYKNGGMEREQLEMALLESLAKHGLNRTNYKRVKARTQQSCWSIIGIVKPLDHPMFSINHPCSIPCCIMLYHVTKKYISTCMQWPTDPAITQPHAPFLPQKNGPASGRVPAEVQSDQGADGKSLNRGTWKVAYGKCVEKEQGVHCL